jgi:hypothetical protein
MIGLALLLPSSPSATAAPVSSALRYDGLYCAPPESGAREYLRFYSDGVVVTAVSTGTPRQVSRWLRKHYSWLGGTGRYTLRGDTLRMRIEAHGGVVVTYRGRARPDSMSLTTHSNNGYRAVVNYRFLRLVLPRDTPNQAMQLTASKLASSVYRVLPSDVISARQPLRARRS